MRPPLATNRLIEKFGGAQFANCPMSRVVSVRSSRVRVADMVGKERQTAEQMHQALANDLLGMRKFNRANPMVQLAGFDRAYVSAVDNMFHAELTNVRNFDAAVASAEAAEFCGYVTCIEGTWTLAVPLRTAVAMPGGAAMLTLLLAIVLFVVAAAVVYPDATMQVVAALYVRLWRWISSYV